MCGPLDGCKDAHKGVFRELTSAGCRWGKYGNCVCSSSPRASYNHHVTSRHDLWAQLHATIHPMLLRAMWWVACYSSASLRRSLLALLSMVQCVVSALVELHKTLVLFQVLSLPRHLPQECTLQ